MGNRFQVFVLEARGNPNVDSFVEPEISINKLFSAVYRDRVSVSDQAAGQLFGERLEAAITSWNATIA